jgi:DNA polymerase-1
MNFIPDLVLVDGSSFMFRAYHSSLKKNFRNSKQEPVGAVMIFAKMLTALRTKYERIPCIMVFDSPVHCFRYDIYDKYKANRKSMDEDLRVQCPRIHAVSSAMGCDVLVVEGYEADDVIGTYARLGSSQGDNVLICTGDKDLYQLVGDKVLIENTMTDEIIDRSSGMDKYGIPPELMVDYLALVGDSSDNIPGMQGTGPKTAEAVLNAIGSVAEIEKNPDLAASLSFRGAKNFPSKFRESLEDIKLSYRLATIVCDVDVPIAYRDLKWHEPDYAALGQIYRDCGLNALLRALPAGQTGTADVLYAGQGEVQTPNQPTDSCEQNEAFRETVRDAEIVNTSDSLEALKERILSDMFFVMFPVADGDDYMTCSIAGIGVGLSDNSVFYIPLRHSYIGVPEQLELDSVVECFGSLLENEDCVKVIFDAKRFSHILWRYGRKLQGVVYDPQIEAWLLDSVRGSYELPVLAYQNLNITVAMPEEITSGKRNYVKFSDISFESAGRYAGVNLVAVRELHDLYASEMKKSEDSEKRYMECYLPMIRVLSHMEQNGVLVSVPELNLISNEFSERLDLLRERIFFLAGRDFNISSPKQVAEVLFEEQKMVPLDPSLRKKIESGKFTTNEEMLQDLSLNYELPADILEYRGLTKLISTYSSVLPTLINASTGRIHTTFHLNGTSTGRLSSSNPNLQNIPVRTAEGRKIRRAFIAREGYKIIAADYSQVELRILAHLSDDKALIDSFVKGEDIHRRTAAEILGIPFDSVTAEQRRSAKAINFGILYGMSAFGLAKQLKIDRKTAQKYIDGYFSRYGSIRSYLDNVVSDAQKHGYVSTVTGRRIPIKDIQSGQGLLFKAASRVATNAPMQGSAADIIQKAMIDVENFINHEAEKDSVYLILQVHDELVLEVREDLAEEYASKIAKIMSSAGSLRVPLEVGVGIADNWEQAH